MYRYIDVSSWPNPKGFSAASLAAALMISSAFSAYSLFWTTWYSLSRLDAAIELPLGVARS
jgi:hypothetical protein